MIPHMSKPDDLVTFTVTISPLTPLCASKFSESFLSIEIVKFPFKIGRDGFGDRGFDSSSVKNDLSIPDGEPFQVSRKHCLIEREGECFYVRDTGSSLGTIVNGTPIGVKSASLSQLLGLGKNNIILGTARSPFKFQVEIA
jgi:pSer/pThr/pTyr-binding forkhead associated (FHA) protein